MATMETETTGGASSSGTGPKDEVPRLPRPKRREKDRTRDEQAAAALLADEEIMRIIACAQPGAQQEVEAERRAAAEEGRVEGARPKQRPTKIQAKQRPNNKERKVWRWRLTEAIEVALENGNEANADMLVNYLFELQENERRRRERELGSSGSSGSSSSCITTRSIGGKCRGRRRMRRREGG